MQPMPQSPGVSAAFVASSIAHANSMPSATPITMATGTVPSPATRTWSVSISG